MRRTAAAFAFIGALFLSACQLVLVPTSPGSTTCPTGNWSLSSEAVNAMVTKLGANLASNLQVTLSNTGVTVAINADGTWTVTAKQTGSFTGTLMGQPVTGTGVLDGQAKGTYTKTPTAITFTTKSLTGSAGTGAATLTVSGTLGGSPFTNVVFTLPSTNSDDDATEVEDVVGLTGSANYSCGATGALTLTFTRTNIEMKLKH